MQVHEKRKRFWFAAGLFIRYYAYTPEIINIGEAKWVTGLVDSTGWLVDKMRRIEMTS